MKSLPWVLAGVSTSLSIALLLLLLNAAIELDNARTQARFLEHRSEVAILLVRAGWIGDKARDLEFLGERIRSKGVGGQVRRSGIEIGDFVFESSEGLVSDVFYFDSGP